MPEPQRRKAATKTRPAGRPVGGVWEPSAPQMVIYEKVCSGRTQTEVAAEHHISRGRVRAICIAIDKWLIPQFMDSIKEMKSNHTSRLMRIHEKAMAAWERSEADAVEVIETAGSTDKGGHSSRTEKRKGQTGGAQYLDTAKDCLKQIREIWGANAPLQVEHSGELRVAGRSVEEANAELAAKMREALAKLTTPGAN